MRTPGALWTVGTYGLTLITLVLLNFALPRAMPGDPISAMLTDDSLPTQFRAHITGLARGDLGASVQHRVPVRDLVALRLPRSACSSPPPSW